MARWLVQAETQLEFNNKFTFQISKLRTTELNQFIRRYMKTLAKVKKEEIVQNKLVDYMSANEKVDEDIFQEIKAYSFEEAFKLLYKYWYKDKNVIVEATINKMNGHEILDTQVKYIFSLNGNGKIFDTYTECKKDAANRLIYMIKNSQE